MKHQKEKKHECQENLQFQSTSCSQPEEQEVKRQLWQEPQESGKQFKSCLRYCAEEVLQSPPKDGESTN